MATKRSPIKQKFLTGILLFGILMGSLKGQILKSIVYDFDGFDIDATNLPEGDYKYGDLTYHIAANPLPVNSGMLGDRVLRMDVNWVNGYAAFGRGISRYVEMDHTKDVLNFYFYNPSSNNQSATIDIKIADDDNQNNTYESASDDNWEKALTIPTGAGWQLITVPLNSFIDGNAGGNGIFDIAFTQNKGMLLLVEFRFNRATPTLPNAVFYMDMICFSEGNLPIGATNLDLPAKSPGDHCYLGAHRKELPGEYYKVPANFENQFPASATRNIKYAHSFMQWGTDGTPVAKAMPGAGFQTLIDNGYTPILTWEPQFKGYSALDPVQPRLNNIINGDYNTYIDDFADKMKLYSDTIIIRFMHEFDGDWYPWCVSQNGNDPAKFALAFQKVVQRFKVRGATKVKWMWCPNNDYKPYAFYNFIVQAYPGNSFVDIVGTDIYNAHYPVSVPWWRSFRWQTTEIYYYFTKYFPTKPVFICELASRERFPSELTTSQSKAGWFDRMDKELQSNFHKVRAIVFFDENKDQTWHVNSSTAALQSLTTHVWNDDYYFNIPPLPTAIKNETGENELRIYPNPVNSIIHIDYPKTVNQKITLRIRNMLGATVYEEHLEEGKDAVKKVNVSGYDSGIYFIELSGENYFETRKVVVERD